MTEIAAPALQPALRSVLVTGGCGFIGCNLVSALAARDEHVIVLDNFSRAGADENAGWLKQRHGDRISIAQADVRDAAAVDTLVSDADAVLHLAGQVAVTTSLEDPKADFDINARGTLNVLEAVRRYNPKAPIVFASTNKVYGQLLDDFDVVRRGSRYCPRNKRLAVGVTEDTRLDFHSPYGCSKGAADQYVQDYARVFGLRTTVLRMSCIYGPRQFGNEDQGWIAHFFVQAVRGEPVTIYGTGFQVRDALFIDDAVAAWLGVLERSDTVSGNVFNLGGGPANALSLQELLDLMIEVVGYAPRVLFDNARPGDQPGYVSNIDSISEALDWSPRVALREGLSASRGWVSDRFSDRLSSALRRAHA